MKNIKKKAGISLIVLVITILVMIILATAVILTLQDSEILPGAKEAKESSDFATLKEAANTAYSSYLVAKTRAKEVTDDSSATEYVKKALQSKGFKDEDIAKVLVVNGNIVISTTGDNTKQWSLADNDSNSLPSIGDLLTPTISGLENEKFYVIADKGDTVTLLAALCIDTNSKKQVFSGYSMEKFDDDSDIYEGSEIQKKVDAYVAKLTENGLTLEDVEVEYGGSVEAGIRGRLMWIEELEALGGSRDDIHVGGMELINNSQEYWLGSYNGNTDYGGNYFVSSSYDCVYTQGLDDVGVYTSVGGVRPVIEISKSLIK